MLKPQRHQRERQQREHKKGMWTYQRMSSVGCEWGRSGGWVLASHILRVVVGWVRIGVPPGLVGKPALSHGTKCKANVGPKVTMWRGVIWPSDSLLLGGRERELRGGWDKGLNTPQWDLAWSDWLGSYGSCWLEVGAEGEFKLDLRQDHDPGTQKLKGAVRTETYQHHYCQHYWLLLSGCVDCV
jgi:hypothetical protein